MERNESIISIFAVEPASWRRADENASVQQVISFALQVQDVHKTHCITRAKLESLLNGTLCLCIYYILLYIVDVYSFIVLFITILYMY